MSRKPCGALPGRLALAISSQPIIPLCLLAIMALSLAGCGAGGASSSSAASGSPVILGTALNSLPAIPAQTNVNTYSAPGWEWYISLPNRTYNYTTKGPGGTALQPSAGIFSSVGDFEGLGDDFLGIPFGFDGLNVEIPSGVSLLQPAIEATSDDTLAVGVPLPATGCLAPNGTVTIDYLDFSSAIDGSKTVATDALYASAGLNYKDGTFSYSNAQQFALGGASASTNTIPFVDSYCIQSYSGYAIESTAVPVSSTVSNTLLTYLGTSGVVVGGINGGNSLVGIVEPSAPIDLSAVTAGSYRGFYYNTSSGSYPGPAYFGTKSEWVASPVFKQTGSSLVGGNTSFQTFAFTYPPLPVPGNILINFGTQDSSHPGLFPSATITEPSSTSCPASDQSTGLDDSAYCTFPVAALIGKSYGKYIIFVSGPELTTTTPLFYALVQD
jgi:hypothetical protein